MRWLLIAALGLLAATAQAHKPSDAYLRLALHGQVLEQRLDIALRDLDRVLQLDTDDDGTLSWGEVRSRAAEIEALAAQGLKVELKDAAGAPCPAGPLQPLQLDSHSDGRYLVLRRSYACPAAAQDLTLGYRLFAADDPTHRVVTHLELGQAGSQTLVIAPDGQPHRLPLGAAAPGLGSFFTEGVHHIWAGYDHILFLLSLLLPAVLVRPSRQWEPAPRLRPVLGEVLGVVTAFTVAHSITLALAAFDIVNPPTRWIESLIAFSVLLAALNNLWPVLDSGRWRITFLFGLVHGFGFASALKDLDLGGLALAGPLVMFNLGVEAGQLAIVAGFMPLAWALRKRPAYAPGLLGGGSAAIALLAGVWLVERVFDLQVLFIQPS
ncbi:HupE/UreJ family protein [Pelomonas sp. KK5]|uniref:HupE/UreJ family protein n=1 Tax=Pelomonas sp. KK5 TaxID=1855730 RepID=UPI00097C278E|nr:HupE/UreJ family protein [Pelomonas sp. KK5]